ncbi:MAG: cupredoxin domain-containing protein [Pirellulaceae bacterium]
MFLFPPVVASLDAAEIAVVLCGTTLIGIVLWYFFGPKKRTTAQVGGEGVQEIRVIVKGGYAPDVIVVKQNQPVRLDFYRDETASCSEQVRFPDFGIVRDLPAFKTTPIEFTPTEAGEFIFTCGMTMLRGKLLVEAD